MKPLKQYEFWFITGSQHLYGPETLEQVAANARVIAEFLDAAPEIPGSVVYKPVVKTPAEITEVMNAANYDANCAGIITWMHTFSPSKMWINGLSVLNKPMLHLHTQFNREIPVDEIDMDFMNLHQSAHGDREHGFIGARMRCPRKIVAGYWEDAPVRGRIGDWMRSAVGIAAGKMLNVVRFGDNMRQVAVTEGDKVEAQIKFGWQVNTHGVGVLADGVAAVSEAEVEQLMAEYERHYVLDTDNLDAVRYQARLEIALRRFFEDNQVDGFTDTFEDLAGLEQLPGLAAQRLMGAGYGFAGEGDWKTAALLSVMKRMEAGLEGGTTFMEDYTYHFGAVDHLVLGAHMLEICPSIAAGPITVSVEPLGIGGKKPPARMKFQGRTGKAICVSLIDMGGRMRMIVNDVEAVEPIAPMPKLPVAQVMWKPMPDLTTSAEAWILAGGAHHTVMSYSLNAGHMRDFAEMAGIEFVHIHQGSNISELKRDLMLADVVWRFR